MKARLIICLLVIAPVFTFAQNDTLSYKVTSRFKNGGKRTDLIELADGYIENAFYQDGKHYCWTKSMDANKRVKLLYEFNYAKENDFNSQLSVKIHSASYSYTFYSGSGLSSMTNTININSDTPKYSHEKTIIVKNDGYVVYQYAAGLLHFVYYYNKDGVLIYMTQNGKKWEYKVDGNKMIQTSPNGHKEEYDIDEDGYGETHDGDFFSWALSDFGRIKCYLTLPKLLD